MNKKYANETRRQVVQMLNSHENGMIMKCLIDAWS